MAPTRPDSATSSAAPARRVGAREPARDARRDASMNLLRQIAEQPIDPDYAVVAARGAPPSRRHWMLALTLALAGVLLTVAFLQTNTAAPLVAKERADLIDRVRAAEARQDDLSGQVAATSEEIRQIRSAALGDTAEADRMRDQINQLDPTVGQVPVSGPGLVITVDDSASISGIQGQVLDIDMQQLANGLWAAGAEAVSINDHRLTSLTAIRGAGDAITVNYRSLTRPYRIVAIGDPHTLESQFVETTGGQWWNGLRQNLGMRYDVANAPSVTVVGDPRLTLRSAKEKK